MEKRISHWGVDLSNGEIRVNGKLGGKHVALENVKFVLVDTDGPFAITSDGNTHRLEPQLDTEIG